jgi:hypothetical protein
MGLHAYCITPAAGQDSAAAAPQATGIDGVPVRIVVANGLALWVTDHDNSPGADVAAVQQHNAVVVAAMTDAVTPIPLRFGQWFGSDAAARDALRTSHEKWAGLLERFAGAVEYGVRVFEPDRAAETTSAAVTGAQYMASLAQRARAESTREHEALAALRAATAGLVMDERVEPLRTAHGVVSVAHLLHASHADAYRAAVDGVGAVMTRLRLLSSGPWPPYSFIE